MLTVPSPGDHLAGDPGRDVAGGQHGERPVEVGGRHQRHHADAHVERPLHLGLLHPAGALHSSKTGCGRQVARSTVADRSGGSTRARLAASPPPVTWLKPCDLGLLDQRQAVLGVDPGRRRAGARRAVPPSSSTTASSRIRAPASRTWRTSEKPLLCRPLDAHRDDDVALADGVGPEDAVLLDHADAGAGDVVVVGRHQPGVLGGLAADERAAGRLAALGDAADDLGDPLRARPGRRRCSPA